MTSSKLFIFLFTFRWCLVLFLSDAYLVMLHFPGAGLQRWLASPCSHYVVSNCFCSLSDPRILPHLYVLREEGKYLAFSWSNAWYHRTSLVQYKDLHRDPPAQSLSSVGAQIETCSPLCELSCYWRCRIPLHRV